MSGRQCTKCGSVRFNSNSRCMDCRNARARRRNERMKANGGHHTVAEWRSLLAASPCCAECGRPWEHIPRRPDPRYRFVWTKGHKVHVTAGGTNDISNLQAECYQCNFRKNAGRSIRVRPQSWLG
ncbi:HNH endonuclease [Phreatobacter sp. AB_2022a]|uniref:HNH endonuclease n=1 Tax=Phreatobacter sp. AB_2022a TaxID=3003134 RepID=UPI003FA6E595